MRELVIYTKPFCPYCERALALLRSKPVKIIEFADASTNPERRAEMLEKSNGRTTYPQIFLEHQHIGGCDDLMALEARGEFDALIAAPLEKSGDEI